MGAKLFCCCRRSEQEENEQLTQLILTPKPPTEEKHHGKLLVFINPHSGRGKSLKTFADRVAPKLDGNLISYEIVVTTGPNHARDVLVAINDLGTFNGILILSGDGLVFETLNGILNRENGFKILRNLPIGIIPSGSGNGLLCSVLAKYRTNLDEKAVMDRAIEITTSSNAKAESVSMYQVKTESDTYASFLSIGWGLLADIDIESERWRKIGHLRFDLMGFIRSCNLRSYKGRLSYRPYKANGFNPSSNVFNVYDRTTQERIEGSEIDSTDEKKLPEFNQNQWTLHDSKEDMTSSEPEDVLKDVVIEDDFIGMYAVTLSHINLKHAFAPCAKLEENKIHLSYILWRDIRTRLDVAKYLLAMENGEHLNLPFVKTVEVSSVKLEVLSQGSYVVLDGEVINTKSLEVFSTRNNFCVFSSAE